MIATIPAQVATEDWRGRLALAVDILVGVATFLILYVIGVLQQALLGIFDLWRSELWHNLFLFSLWFGLFGTILAGHVLLARRGQTVGLALLRLRWCTPAGHPATRRLLSEPQVWCASGPALFFTLSLALALLLSLGPAWAVYGMWLPYLLCAVLVVGAVVAMVLARRSPGQLVADPFPTTPHAAHLRRVAEWGVLGLGAVVTCLTAATIGAPIPWAQFLFGLITASCIAVAILSAIKALYHAFQYVQSRG